MHEILLALRELAPAAIIQTVQAIALLTWAFALYGLLLLYVMPRVQGVDVSGWVFAGPLTLSVACLIVCAAFGIGSAAQVIIAAGLSVAAILTSVVGLLLGYKSMKVRAENQPPIAPAATVTNTATVAPDGAVTTEQKTEPAP